MPNITIRDTRRTTSLRTELLDTTCVLLSECGYAGLRMATVAARAGVSRQTVYNEFGTKAELVQAVVLRTTAEFLEGIRLHFEAAADLLDGAHAAIVYTLQHATENPLVAAALGTGNGEDLLPLLTTRGEPVLRAAAELASAQFRERMPQLDKPRADLIGETITRLTMSHIVIPTESATSAADSVCAALKPLIDSSSGIGELGRHPSS